MIHISYWSTLLLPLFFWAAYHYYKDRHQPEPIGLLILSIVLGYISAHLGIFMYHTLDWFGLRFDAYSLSNRHLFLYALLVIGPIEEFAKFLPFIIVVTRLRHFDEPLDGIIYSSFIAFGFSLHENQAYISSGNNLADIARAIASPIIHGLFASIWGYACGLAFHQNKSKVIFISLGLLCSMITHGIYDYFSIARSQLAHIIPPIIIGIIWFWRLAAIKQLTTQIHKEASDQTSKNKPK